MNKDYIFAISGGLTFKDEAQMHNYYKKQDIEINYDTGYWMDWLVTSLEGEKNIKKIKMPGFDNANYGVWKIIFEKYLEKYKPENLDVVGHSLGTTFIMKYLVESNLKIRNLHLVASFVSDEFQEQDFDMGSGSFTYDFKKLETVSNRISNITIWHSTDDTTCPLKNPEYLKDTFPNAKLNIFHDRGHFNTATFPELLECLK